MYWNEQTHTLTRAAVADTANQTQSFCLMLQFFFNNFLLFSWNNEKSWLARRGTQQISYNCLAIRDFQTHSVHWKHWIGIVNVAHVHVSDICIKRSNEAERDGKIRKTNKALKQAVGIPKLYRRTCKHKPFTKENGPGMNVDHFGNLIILSNEH